MRHLIFGGLLGLVLASVPSQVTEAPTGFDNKSNGVVDGETHQADQKIFDETEAVKCALDKMTDNDLVVVLADDVTSVLNYVRDHAQDGAQ